MVKNSMFWMFGIGLGLVLAAAGCAMDNGVEEGPLGDAEAQIGRTIAEIPVIGEGDFEELPNGDVEVEITIEGAPPGVHAVHIHEFGDCGNAGENAGMHWNPEGTDHGMLGGGHLGDIGNMTVRDDGVGSLEFSTPLWTVGDGSATDIEGKAVIIHAGADDFGQPSGNAGDRIGCGIIEADID
ncbi:MAG TPA: superoxide dismutase family protein [Kofleriaceae bacterium]|nr:superoxide dismutase family protein [Kofleriaceae bacterium]